MISTLTALRNGARAASATKSYVTWAQSSKTFFCWHLRQNKRYIMTGTGWPDWAIFANWTTFGGSLWYFCKDEVAQRNGDILGYFLPKQIKYIFTQINSFKIWFVVRTLMFLKWFDADGLGFQIQLYWHGNCLGYFLNNWANFFSNRLITLRKLWQKGLNNIGI